jgi:phosphohistidine phosphatase
MKRLALLRHAKSSWDDASLNDFDRPLNDRGRKATIRMGAEMKGRGFGFDLVLASTAARVRETIEGVQENFQFDCPICFDRQIYLAGDELLLRLVRDLDEGVERPLLVGHNPGLERLLTAMTGRDDGLGDRARQNFPTCAFALLDVPVLQWREAEPGGARIVEMILPKDLN